MLRKIKFNKLGTLNNIRYLSTIRYTKDHEFVKKQNDNFIIGITNYAAENIGDIVYIDIFFSENDNVKENEVYGLIESVKSASDLFMPLDCNIIKLNNETLENSSEISNDPINNWFCEVKLDDTDEFNKLMGEEEYNNYIEKL